MPKSPSTKLKFIGLFVPSSFVEEIDKQAGPRLRSEYIRVAITEKLERDLKLYQADDPLA